MPKLTVWILLLATVWTSSCRSSPDEHVVDATSSSSGSTASDMGVDLVLSYRGAAAVDATLRMEGADPEVVCDGVAATVIGSADTEAVDTEWLFHLPASREGDVLTCDVSDGGTHLVSFIVTLPERKSLPKCEAEQGFCTVPLDLSTINSSADRPDILRVGAMMQAES